MTMILVIIALVCFAIAALWRGSIGTVNLVPLGLFCWLLATTHETLAGEAGGSVVTVLLVILLVLVIIFVANRIAPAEKG